MWQINRTAPSLCQIHSTHFSTCHSIPSLFLLCLCRCHPVPPLLPSRRGSSQRWRRRQEQRRVNTNKSKQSHRGWAGLRRGWRGDRQERLSSFLSFLHHLSPPVEVVVEALKEKEPLHKQMPGIRLQPGECVNSFSSAINTPQLRIGAFAKCN